MRLWLAGWNLCGRVGGCERARARPGACWHAREQGANTPEHAASGAMVGATPRVAARPCVFIMRVCAGGQGESGPAGGGSWTNRLLNRVGVSDGDAHRCATRLRTDATRCSPRAEPARLPARLEQGGALERQGFTQQTTGRDEPGRRLAVVQHAIPQVHTDQRPAACRLAPRLA